MSEGTIVTAAAASYPWKTLLGVGVSALAIGGGVGVYSQDGDVASSLIRGSCDRGGNG